MSLMSDYESRTMWKYEPVSGCFSTHPQLRLKIDGSGRFRPYLGSTVVFRLNGGYFGVIRTILSKGIEDMLAQPVQDSTFHMTLHDLVNPESSALLSGRADGTTPQHGGDYIAEVERSLDSAARITDEIRREFAGARIEMVSDRVVNMVSKSLVMLLKPASESDWRLLLKLYRRYDGIIRIPYPLTPHVTLAYFRPGQLDGARLSEAIARVQVDPEDPMPISLSIDWIAAQRFRDMGRYEAVPTRVCFCCDGGMNRSVMAAAVLNQRARERGLPIRAEARAAFPNTDGRQVPGGVREALERFGISTAESRERAQYLRPDDTLAFDRFVAMTGGAQMRINELGKRAEQAGAAFMNLPDPQFGASHDDVLALIRQRMDDLLDALATGGIQDGNSGVAGQ